MKFKNPHEILELSEENKVYLAKIADKARKTDVRLDTPQMEALEIVYHAITKRVLSKGCSTCIPDAYKIIRNYLATYPDPRPKVLSKKVKTISLSNSKVVQDDLTFTKEEEKEEAELIKEIKAEKPKAKKKPAPRKKRTKK